MVNIETKLIIATIRNINIIMKGFSESIEQDKIKRKDLKETNIVIEELELNKTLLKISNDIDQPLLNRTILNLETMQNKFQEAIDKKEIPIMKRAGASLIVKKIKKNIRKLEKYKD